MKIGPPGDHYEQEADRLAAQVMHVPAPSSSPAAVREHSTAPSLQAKCAHCEEEEKKLQRKESGAVTDIAPPIVDEVLNSSGEALAPATRGLMETRFGHDFSHVRVHSGDRAAESARAVNALAYTVGRDIVFGHGQYRPDTNPGQQLLTHELVHTLQQRSGPPRGPSPLTIKDPANASTSTSDTMADGRHSAIASPSPRQVARDTPKGGTPPVTPATTPAAAARKDVVLLGIDTPTDAAWATVIAPTATVIKAKNVNEMVAGLKKITLPIGTLFIILHGLPEGDLGFESGDTTTYVLPSKIAEALKGAIAPANAPQFVDFRGCSLGTSPKAMDQMRTAVGGSAARGSNCVVLVQASGPIRIGTTNITTAAQAASHQAAFKTGMQTLIDSFGPAKDCILDTSEEAYFRAGGKMVAEWVNPEDETKFDRKSKCFKSLKTEKADPRKSAAAYDPSIEGNCKLVKVEKP